MSIFCGLINKPDEEFLGLIVDGAMQCCCLEAMIRIPFLKRGIESFLCSEIMVHLVRFKLFSYPAELPLQGYHCFRARAENPQIASTTTLGLK